jgi:hypothetical protein
MGHELLYWMSQLLVFDIVHFQEQIGMSVTPSRILNFAVEWVTLQLHILEAPSSNLSPETSYRELSFSWFSLVLQSNAGIIP